jgi:hypothetical protein
METFLCLRGWKVMGTMIDSVINYRHGKLLIMLLVGID